jgi:phage regulator Rha-like protein
MNQLTQLNQIQTMSSLEIADLTGKRHDNVMADIRRMFQDLNIDAPEFLGTQTYGNNNKREIFNLPKRETLILVSGYSVELRAKIIDRWEELENKKRPMTPMELILQMAQANVELEKKVERQESRIQQIENKIEKRFTDEFLDQFVTPSQIGAMFEPTLSAKKINEMLKAVNFQWKPGKEWVPTIHGKKYSMHDYIQLDNGKMVPQLLWQRKVKELI